MLQIYDKALENLLSKYFSNVVIISEDESNKVTKATSEKYKNIDPPYISILRSVEFDMPDSHMGKKYIKSGIAKSVNKDNGTTKYLKMLDIKLKYDLFIWDDTQNSADNVLSDLIYVLTTYPKLQIESPFNSEFELSEFYTYVELLSFASENNKQNEAGLRKGYSVNIELTGAKFYYSSDIKNVKNVIIDFRGE